MKRLFVVFVAVMVVISSLSLTWAGDSDKASTYLDFRQEYKNPQGGAGETGQSIVAWWQYGSIGGLFEGDITNKSHYVDFKPSLLYRKGSFFFLGGFAADSLGSEFIQTGVWYLNTFGKLNVSLDARNYWSITGKDNGYTEEFLRVTHPIAGKIYGGIDMIFDHWWSGKSHSCYFVGPLVGYKFTSTTSLYLRVSREWDVLGGDTRSTDRLRLGLVFYF